MDATQLSEKMRVNVYFIKEAFMFRLTLILALFFTAFPMGHAKAQENGQFASANYRLAGRFAPYKMQKLIYSTSVQPKWIEGSERFWYEWETADGRFFYLVDPIQGARTQIFDNDRIAAELTRITMDPWDGQHLPIRAIKFLDGNTLQFEVESSQDEEKEKAEAEEQIQKDEQDQEEDARKKGKVKKKVFHFEYTVSTRTLRELEDWEEPDNHPSWANVSPDGQTVIFARSHNLYMMSGESYQQILNARRGKDGEEADEADEEVEIEEIQLSDDGEEHFSYAVRDRGDTDDKRMENKDKRKR
ncbi:uncharacterized protein METZ01_LOCUS213248, partial [marine metagenome]